MQKVHNAHSTYITVSMKTERNLKKHAGLTLAPEGFDSLAKLQPPHNPCGGWSFASESWIRFPLRLQNVREQEMRGGSTNLFTMCKAHRGTPLNHLIPNVNFC